MKVLMIGLGSIGQRHLRNLVKKFGYNLEVLAYRVKNSQMVLTNSLDIEEGAVLKDKYGIKAFGNLEDALAENPQVAFICNPSSLHVESAIAAAKKGCHLFIEKPLSDSLNGIDKLARICSEKKLTVFVAFQLRFHPGLKILKKKIESGAVGDLLSVHGEVGERLTDWHKYEDYRQMYAAKRELGGGVVLTQIHEIDYLYWLFGMPEKVFALGGKLSDLEIDVEDTVDAIFSVRYLGRLLPITLHMDYVQRPPSRSCEVIGTKGKMILDFVKNRLSIQRLEDSNPEVCRFEQLERNALFAEELDHFFRCVETGAKPLVDLNDGILSLKIALAMKKSLMEGRPVECMDGSPCEPLS